MHLTADLECAEYWDHGRDFPHNAYCTDNGVWMTLTGTNPADPLRNIRVVLPGFEDTHVTQPFHPLFLKSLQRYSVLRFMDWARTNHDHPEGMAFRDRVLPSSATQTAGVAWEHVAHLCNVLGATAHVNVPHAADDSFVRALGALLLTELRPDVKVHLEYSNEV